MSAPLSRLKVLDFSTLLPGPYASMMLADMGAEVLRVESPSRVDLLRIMPPFDGKATTGHGFLNRSKRSMALDLKKPGAKELVYELVKHHDIVLEQFRPGVMARLGLDYTTLKAINPKLIYCSISGYGQTGPYKDRAGHDANYLALSGMSSYTGRKASGPLPLGFQVADVAGGSLHGVIAILAAVVQRAETGEGQHLDISMTDAAFSLNALSAAAYLGAGVEVGYEEHPLNGGSFYDYYETADGRYLSIGSLEPQFMQQLCATLGIPGMAAKGLSQKAEDQAELKAELQRIIKQQPLAHWQALFADVDACVEPVLTVAEACDHPLFQARDMLTEVPQPDGGKQRQVASPLRFGGEKPAPKFVGATLGEHTHEVLQELGLPASTIDELRAAGVFGKH